MTRNAVVLWSSAILLAALAGCSIGPEAKTVQLLDPRPDSGPAHAGEPASWSLGVTRPDTDPTRDSNRVLVRTDQGQLKVHPSARWVASAPDLFRTLLIRHLRDQALLAQAGPGAAGADRILAIDLRRFELTEHGGSLAVEITAEARLYDSRSNDLLARRVFDARRGLASARPDLINDGFEQVLAELLPALGDWVVTAGALPQPAGETP